MTFTTLAVDSGVPDQITLAATKHRDPATLKGYVQVNYSTLSSAVLGISHEVKKTRLDKHVPDSSSPSITQSTVTPIQSSMSSSALPTQVFYGNVTIHNK